MADLKLGIVVQAIDKLTAPVKKITAATARMTDEVRRAVRPARVLTDRQRDLRRAVAGATGWIAKQTLSFGRLGRSAAGATGRILKQTLTLKGLAKAGRVAGWGLGILAGAVYGFKRTFIDTAASFERFQTILETIEGSSEKARQSMDWISDFAVKTPFDLDQVTDAFVKLRAYGLDPTGGLLRTLGDTASAMGKPIMQAVEAIADAVTGENERLKEFGIKARAVKGGKFRYEYTVDGETRFAEALADDRAQIQQVLSGIFDLKFSGAMQKQSKTFSGLVSNLMDQWTRFQQMVMASGAFEYLKDRLRALLDTINRMAADGSLQELAERIGRGLVGAFQVAERAARMLWPVAVWIVEALSGAAAAVGGWTRLAVAVAGVYAAVKTGAVKALAGGLFPAAPGVAAPGTGMLAGLTGKLAGFGGVFKPLAAILGLISIKFLAIGAVVAIVAGLVYKYWEPVKAFLSGVWGGFTEALQPVIDALKPAFAAIGEWLQPLIQWFRDLFVPVEMTAQELGGFALAGKAVGKAIGGLIINIGKFVAGLVTLPIKIGEAGVRLVDALIEGIKSGAGKLYDTVSGMFDSLGELLPFSDAKKGPLSRLTASGASILETMGLGVFRAGPGALQRPLARALGTAAAGVALSLPAAGAGPALGTAAGADQSIHIGQLVINQQPGEDAGDLAEKVLREIERRRRLSAREALHDEL